MGILTRAVRVARVQGEKAMEIERTMTAVERPTVVDVR